MSINTSIYGDPSTWSSTQYVPFAKTVNYGTSILNAELTDGVNAGKTPVNELLENSICTAALGSESLYSNIIWEHNGELAHDNADYTPYFYANCYDSSGYIADRGTINTNFPLYNAWKPFQSDTGGRQNKSLHSRVIGEYQPKKILYELIVGVCPSNDLWSMHMYTLGEYMANTSLQTTYPKIFYAGLRAYFDSSTTDTPNRELSASVRLFGACINRELTPFELNYKVDYMLCRGFNEHYSDTHIPIYGQPRTNILKGTNNYNFCLAPENDISIERDYIHIIHDNTSEFIEFLIQQAACFGVFVRISNDSGLPTSTIPLDNNDIICGILSQGIGHGEYTRGTANRDNAIWSWGTNRDSDYDPYKPPHSDYDTQSHFNDVHIANFNRVWVTSAQEVQDLVKEVYKALQRKPTDVQTTDYSADSFLSTDPINGIISVRRYPVNIVPNDNNPVYITIGNYTSDTVQARRYINAPNSQFIDFVFSGAKSFDEAFGGSFLDREPYTTAELYIPFCGTVPISVADYIGHTITVKLAIDYLSGSCTAYVLCDNTPLQSANGQIGIDVPVSGINAATVDSQLLNANLRLKESQRQQLNASTAFFTTPFSLLMSASGGGKYGVSAAAQGVGSLVSMGTNFESTWDNREAAAYELHHIQTPFKSVSAGAPLTAAMGEHCCRLIIYRPILSPDYDPETYAKTIGFACLINGTVSDFSGLTMGTIDLSGVNCSDREKELISAAFARGVII